MSEFPTPSLTDVNRGFWEGAEAGELRVQRCSNGHLRYPNAAWCPDCLDDGWEWTPLSGRGEVLSVLIFHQAYDAAWKERIPYNVVLVQLEEGPRMISNILPLGSTDVVVGDRVEVRFDREGEFSIPRFVKVVP